MKVYTCENSCQGSAVVQKFLFLSKKHTSSESMICLSKLHLCDSSRWFTGCIEIHVAEFMLFCLRKKNISDMISTWDPLFRKLYMQCNCTRHRTGIGGFCVSIALQLRRRKPDWFSLPQSQRPTVSPKHCAVRNTTQWPEHVLHRIRDRQCPFHWTANKSEFL